MANEQATPMIECENLVKIYKTPDVEVLALQGLEVRIERGELMAIIGNSGSGKSTFLNMIGGLDRPSAGRLVVDGKDLFKMNERELVQYKRSTVVDVKTGAYILDMFRDINRSTGLTIVIVTHDRLLAKKVNRVVTIRDGKISSERILKQSYLDRLHDITSFTDVKRVQDEYAILDRAGRVQLPRELLEQLELTGNKVRLELVDGRIVIEKPEAAEDAE